MAFLFNEARNFTAYAKDGEIGRVKDMLFDDRTLNMRYVVIDKSRWLPGNKILLSPYAIESCDYEKEKIYFDLNQRKIQDAPSLEDHLPVSRQFESQLYHHYSWIPYWTGAPLSYSWYPYPGHRIKSSNSHPKEKDARRPWGNGDRDDQNLRSCREICGYRISSADDEEFGELSDLIITDDDFLLIDLVVCSRRWLPGGKTFCLSPLFAAALDEIGRSVHMELSREAILSSPPFQWEYYGEPYRKSLAEHYQKIKNQGPESSGNSQDGRIPVS
ncbi:PRC-barrel domain-containing protein [Pseudobacteriovorax antillogorgiicola]|uniref:PRC-barrel domain-containing protein n=1 Tax=Pseudobacteriovorax antillogorgiicola TaxID=1513793 RepID=A0A1Y6BSA7_9BACT|nr:PRC-barrel domain-containing protein [Pseudobacteriovorax antillogorgiicola]TCS53028.1 PRC-barrel domain protein [Pseudobacteriovorax antillogorgiicola]SMF26802.1 PRC-barrel domain-containing protein [Pseudobacteriovorax antillogorgiicola]